VTKHDALRKQRIIEYIAATLRARGYPPSVREIAQAVDLASTSAVHHHLAVLERDGYLERGATQSRALRLTPRAALAVGLTSELVPQAAVQASHFLPVIGEIAAGGPIEATKMPARASPCQTCWPRAVTPTCSACAAIR
jgi:repressor LexA